MPAPRELPIYQLEESLVLHLRATNRLILQAPTGSGKSTQVPQMLLEHGFLPDGKRAVILQPRRLATRMLAARVARERGVQLGGEVGYTIRFDNQTSRETRLQFVTEGILLRQMLSNPRLPQIGAILFDEFHERHLFGDITLARALDLQEQHRPDLKLIVMSATLETGVLEKYLGRQCETLTSSGRTFPVDIDHIPARLAASQAPVWELAADELERLTPESQGDALIFMPGAYEIGRTIQEVRMRRALDRTWIARPLHGELPPGEQDAALAPVLEAGRRKVVVATNVAETSLTIDGVRLVIDSGLARIAKFDPYRGINTLLIEKISRASADQRAGRAGRTAPGLCVRLWTQDDHFARAAQELPEVKRLDLAEIVLTLKASGVRDVHAFRWLEAPERRSLERAERLLESLGAIEREGGEITELGRRMLAFPVHPRYARMFLAAQDRNCVPVIARLAALTQGRPLFVRPIDKMTESAREDLLGRERESDFFLLQRALRYAEKSNFDPGRLRRLGIHGISARAASDLAEQFLRIAKDEGLATDLGSAPASADVRKCILAGFADQVAKRLDTGTLRCALVGGRRGVLARDSAVDEAPLLVVGEVREIEGRDAELNTLLSQATAIEEDWLRELFPRDFRDEDEPIYDAQQRRVYLRRRRYFRDLPLAEKMMDDFPRDLAAGLLAAEVHAGRLRLELLDENVEQWVARLNSLALWMPELELPPLREEDRLPLLEQLCLGSFTYNQIKDKPVAPVFRTWLNRQQLAWLEEYAPDRLDIPGARKAPKLRYSGTAEPPVVAARIQDLYAVEGGLFVAARRVPVTIEVLAPNMRPVQVTKDLATFWRESYPKLKQELQRRYPKHEWR